MDPRYDSFQKAGNGRTRQPLNELSNYICFSFVRKQKKNDVIRVLIILVGPSRASHGVSDDISRNDC